MKTLITNLSNTINYELHLSTASKEIIVTENNQQAACKKVVLKVTSANVFAFSLDYQFQNKTKMFPFFDQSLSNVTKVNDGIIFYIYKSEIHIFLVELKSNNLSEYKIQLQAGKYFILYLKNMINLVFKKNYNIDEENIKCLVFTTKRIPLKQGTRRRNVKYEIINGLHISYHPCADTFYLDNFCRRN